MPTSLDEEIEAKVEKEFRRKQDLESIKVIQKNQLTVRPGGQSGTGGAVQKSKTRKGKAARQIAILEGMYEAQVQTPERPATGQEGEQEPVVVPNLIGASPDQAASELSQLGLKTYPNFVAQKGITEPEVVGSDPGPGSEARAGQTVTLMVAIGEEEEEEDEEKKEEKEPGEKKGEGIDEKAGEGLAEGGAAEGAGVAAGGTAAEGAAAEGAATAGAGAAAWFGAPAAVIAAGIAAVLILVVVIFMILFAGCNQGGWKGVTAKTLSKGASFFGYLPADVCKELAVNDIGQGGQSGGAGGGTGFGGLSDAAARSQLLQRAGVTINKPQPATSLEGIQQATIDEIVNFAIACGKYANPSALPTANACNVQFSGGTETGAGHAGGPCSHLSGNKADIGTNGVINRYIFNVTYFTRIPDRMETNGARTPQYQNRSTGVVYAQESGHWDIGGVGCS